MKPVDRCLLFVMKMMVWHFVSFHKVLIAHIDIFISECFYGDLF
jgi:hypothetical protein